MNTCDMCGKEIEDGSFMCETCYWWIREGYEF